MTSSPSVRLGTRGSQLALYQAHTVARLLAEAGGPSCEIVVIRTSGDRLQEAPLSEAGGKRLFVKEIEDALLNADIDLAVHSSKDMPAVLPDGLTIAGVLVWGVWGLGSGIRGTGAERGNWSSTNCSEFSGHRPQSARAVCDGWRNLSG
jgi:hypothetical protein